MALRVVREHSAGLGNIATVALRNVGLENAAIPLVLAGGVFRHPTTVLEDAIVSAIRPNAPEVRPMRSPTEPIIGVMLQALSVSGVAIAQPLLDRLMADMPAALLSHRVD